MSVRSGASMRLASLPMYDLPETGDATRALWNGLAQHLRSVGILDAPDSLTRQPSLPDHWLSADLLFSQTCGYPLTHALRGRVSLVATPCYDAPGCEDASYCSIVVVPAGAPTRTFAELRSKRAALNSTKSHSGFNALRALAAPLAKGGRFFGEAIESGSHAASLELVSAGQADVAAIDCVTFALLSRYRPPAIAHVRELCRSALAPALPYVTSGTAGDHRIRLLRQGLQSAMDDPALAEARAALLLKGARRLPEQAYRRIIELEDLALDHGYPALN
jgi:ABC-type phosphate/phosphonate transport system substrate-binding protein